MRIRSQGDRNKHTLINVFSGDVIVQEFPANLQFGINVEYLPQYEDALEFWFHLKADNKLLMKVQVSFPSGTTKAPSTIIIQSLKVNVENDLSF